DKLSFENKQSIEDRLVEDIKALKEASILKKALKEKENFEKTAKELLNLIAKEVLEAT
ncbi:35174_t:CDS:1, partial [Racocetra persica]